MGFYDSEELVSKAIGHSNNHMTVNMLKADVESVKEGRHNTVTCVESRNCEERDPSQHSNGPGAHCHVDTEVSIKGDWNEGEHVEAPYSLSTGNLQLAEKETDFYTDKTVTEMERREPTSCFTNVTCHTVKDICIDKEVHFLEKVLVETNVEQKLSSRYDDSVPNGNYKLTNETADSSKDMTDNAEPISHGLESLPLNEHPISVVDKDDTEQCSSESLFKGGGKLDAVAPSVVMISKKQLLPLLEFDTDMDTWKVVSSSFENINDHKQSNDHQKSDEGTLEEEISTAKTVSSSTNEPIQSNGIKGSPIGEPGVITFRFDSGVATLSGREESKENTDQKSGQVRYVPKSEEATLDVATASARSSFVHCGNGGLNFYGPASLTDPIASSGHIIPYSGSISLRSDSSTTSAHSFAFPVLQSEWNSSPVKMAKADRRNLRKHRRWKMGLLCCRF